MLNPETEKLPHIQRGSMAEKMLESILSGKSTINEARASFGLDPIEDGNVLYQRHEVRHNLI